MDESVLIVESAQEFGRALTGELDSSCRVSLCTEGGEALELLRAREPDILVLDLLLPGMDGLSLLESLRLSGRKPRVVAVTAYVSPYILETLEALGTAAVLQKPCSPEAAAAAVKRLLQQKVPPAAEDVKGRISAILLRLGFSSKLRGFAYLREAVYQILLEPDRAIVKELYDQVGRQYAVPAALVEHSIRCAIREAWKHRDPGRWARWFPCAGEVRPASAAVIRALADSLRDYADGGQKQSAGEKVV